VRAELHLARRYLAGLRRRTHVATVSLISLIGLALGVMALVVTLALLEGFQASIRHELVSRATHARVEPSVGRRLPHPDRLASDLQAAFPGVELVMICRGTCLVTSLTDAVPASLVGRSDAEAVEVDQVLSLRLGAVPGDSIELISPRQRLTPMGPLPIRARLTVESIAAREPGTESGLVRVPLATAQRLLWGEEVVEALELRDENDPWNLGASVSRRLGDADGLAVQGLNELHRPLLLALALERVTMFIAVGLMLVVASLNLLCNLAMIAAEKRRDLAVLSGLGMGPNALRRLFVWLGLGIGAVGAVSGGALGVSLALILDVTQALPLPRGVFMVSSVPFAVRPVTVALVLTVAMLLALAASWVPARMVARREPAEGMRYE